MYIKPDGEMRAALDWLEKDEIIQEGLKKIQTKLETQYARMVSLLSLGEDAPGYDAPHIVVIRWANAMLRTTFRILNLRENQICLQKLLTDFYDGLPIDLTVLRVVLRLADYDQ